MIYHTQAVTPVTPDSSTNKTDSHDTTEILLKVARKKENTRLFVCLFDAV
jgi:hypothetical protein